ncbi:MAG: inositol monophosphatase [Candidatus Heimdallarchaeota archaeon]|nr:inositol monophosphatase [Candidatus Heimdallarchaeota archaeon]
MEEHYRIVAEQAAKMAGSFLRLMSFKDLQVFRKGDDDFVTNFDMESERLIKNHILMHFPTHLIQSEESEIKLASMPEEVIWYIDPLDGTKAFLRGNLAFVSMSIAAWDKNGLVAGVVYNPFTDMLYSAARNGSARLNGSNLFKPKTYPIQKARLLIDFSDKIPKKLQYKLATADISGRIGRSYRLGGGISQHLMLIAQGTLHGGLFWGAGYKGQFWDIAAANLIIKRLGLEFTNLDGDKVHPSDEIFDQLVIACNPLHSEILEWVKDLKSED